MADMTKQKEDGAVGDERESSFASDAIYQLTLLATNVQPHHAPAEALARKPSLDVLKTGSLPELSRKSAARCKQRADYIIQILEEWQMRDLRVFGVRELNDLIEAFEDEKNHNSETMQKLVIKARDLFAEPLEVDRDLRSGMKTIRFELSGHCVVVDEYDQAIQSIADEIHRITAPRKDWYSNWIGHVF
ncbi:hypothetical protein KC316_g1863 [Hortaea werneckii]|nr:hypothetical protein KC324_g3378 [Hortaea werneckii]KAI7593222.1 hypothetical protein KC316_g1863 [Hortaea werneckii]